MTNSRFTKVSITFQQIARENLAIFLVLLIALAFAGAGLNMHVFWDDEASTALFAKEVLSSGQLSGWNGLNINSFRGGINLDEHLLSREGIPLQHYVAAAGIKIFGDATWAARLPFLIFGLLTLWLTSRWSTRLFGSTVPNWLPALLLACNVSFSMHIIQSRYYALVMAFSAAVLWAMCCLDGKRRWPAFAGGAVAALGLAFSNSLCGIAMVAACMTSLMHPRFRTYSHIKFVALVGGITLVAATYFFVTTGGIDNLQSRRGATDFTERIATLLAWQIKGLALSEFLPLLPLFMFALPWKIPRLMHLRPVVGLAITVLAMILASLIVIAALSPQDVTLTHSADMRYLLPILVMGSVVTAVALTIIAAGFGKAMATLVFAIIIFSNLTYGALPSFRCTVCERLYELSVSHPSGSDAVVNVAKMLPADTRTMFYPEYIGLPAMYYRPDLKYVAVIDSAKYIDPDLRRKLPDYVFTGRNTIDILVVGIGSMPLSNPLEHAGQSFELLEKLDTNWIDMTRPDIRWHQFRANPDNDKKYGIAIFRRIDAVPAR